MRYHINNEGEAGSCSADVRKCPFGADRPHFDSKKEAQKFYENSQTSFKAKKIKKTKVYRVGTLTPPESHFSDLNDFLTTVDSYKPEGRQGRYGAIFASPDMSSHSRWILGSRDNKHEEALDSHEITVDENSVYVYDVKLYENSSRFEERFGKDSEKFKEEVKKFWESGMTLADWKDWAKENNPEPGSWEIIMPNSSIISAKKMSNKRIIENIEDDNKASEINSILEPKRFQKGLLWRKKKVVEPAENNKVD